MKISLTGLLFNDSRMHAKLSKILTDEGKAVPAEVALDLLIQEYVNLRLGGTSKLVGESCFPDREFVLQVPNDGTAAPEVAIPAEQWHEDDGPVLWWMLPINEVQVPHLGHLPPSLRHSQRFVFTRLPPCPVAPTCTPENEAP
jgi:hypothetical protein